MILRSAHVRDVTDTDRSELKALLDRTHYPDMFRWQSFARMVTVRDLISDTLVGALTYRGVDGPEGRIIRLGKFVTAGTPRERYRVMQHLLREIAFVGQFDERARWCFVSVDTRTHLYRIVVRLLARHGFTATTPERENYTAWTRKI